MPNIPRITRKSSVSRMVDQMQNEYFRAHMSEEEKIAGRESFKAYLNTIGLYVKIEDRAKKNRSLNYKIETKHQRRIQMTLSLPGSKDGARVEETQKLFPLVIMLARLVSSNKPTAEDSAVYKFSRACSITGVDDDGEANFLLPDMGRLALKAESLAILFISFAGAHNSQFSIDSGKIHSGGQCLWSKIDVESLYSSWQKYPNLREKATSVSLVEMQPCFLQPMSMTEKCVMIQVPSNPLTSSSPQQVQITISAQEVGATENPPYGSSFSFNYIPDDTPASPVVFPVRRLRKGQVAFNWKYYNNRLEHTEVTEDFTCSFCLVKCGSFKGLECHLPATHDFYNFEFWVEKNYPAVDVSIKCEEKIDQIFIKDKFKLMRATLTQGWTHTISYAYSIKIEKSQIPHGGAESSSQKVSPRMSPEDLQMMQMWKSFARKHRVFADGRIAWGCEAFSKLHGLLMVQNPHLLWCWKKYVWTLMLHGHIDAPTLEKCMLFFEQLGN
ncbi:hypothetical protein N665_1726s0007 [Sinapis alba]|nr:hypothetical protein N665_1726s0007 [Sinapis alba]